ncbi:hypothetical protein ALT761_01891 [Alteromonas sp. 76-1]|jgi:hypothetical protein|uniref:hypothetical protein n=1 Tax=Alteromonas sp. 76-1 TaxID=2358187 RepID=UPI000FD16294|nr:hypothetical protein [Alteromonas sp. 76-1]VEL96898.1 hypothetical protein ALT761_01891 [Alteromonas sp. 76-1]
MEDQFKLLIKAIESLKQEPNIFKDYIFPIVSAFLSALFGALIAYFTLKRQESLKIEKEKLDAANKWTLDIQKARSSLIAIKQNYFKDLSSNPTQRVGSVPSIVVKAENIKESYADLGFIVPTEAELKEKNLKWAQIARVDTLVSNFNSLLTMWDLRNRINEEFKQAILNKHGNGAYLKLSLNDALSAFGQPGMVALIDITERCIKLTDHLIIETNDFLENFPDVVEKKINLRRLKKYSQLLKYHHDGNEKFLEMLQLMPETDYSAVTKVFGETEERLKERHRTGYEQS